MCVTSPLPRVLYPPHRHRRPGLRPALCLGRLWLETCLISIHTFLSILIRIRIRIHLQPVPPQVNEQAQLIFGPALIPTLSFTASSFALSDKVAFPYFFRLNPSADQGATAVARLVHAVGWRQITVLAPFVDSVARKVDQTVRSVSTGLGVVVSILSVASLRAQRGSVLKMFPAST